MTLCSASALEIVDADVLLSDDSTGLEDLMDLYEAMGITSDQAHRSLSFLESMDALIEASVGIASLETFDDYAQDSDYAPEESAPSSDYAPESAPSSDYAPESAPSSDYAPESVAEPASFPLPDSVTQRTVIDATIQSSTRNTPPSATKDNGIVGVGQPVQPLNDTRPDPQAFIAAVEQYSS